MKLENLNSNKRVLYKDNCYSGDYDEGLYLKRAIDDGSNKPKFYLSVFTSLNGVLTQQGYLYFYLDYETKTSNFIGIKVNPLYRDLNIASFLIASWIDLCLNNGYDFLGVHYKQRKPFLLYLLKTYGFEILDKSKYYFRNDVITICRSVDMNDKTKMLLFKNDKHEKNFKQTNIYKSDNYKIIHSTQDVVVLDKVILPLQNMSINPINYELLDFDLALSKVVRTLARHKR